MVEEGPGKNRLGRGLAALIGDDAAMSFGDETAPAPKGVREVPIEFLHANPFQPRQIFKEGDLDDLTQSVREKGILQPIVVRPSPGGSKDEFEIVAGERRWRAAQAAQLHQVPVIVKELNDNESLEIAIIENVQRADLNSVEEAAGYQRLADQFTYTQDQISKMIGKSRSHVANTLRLLSLPQAVQDLVSDGSLSAGHARTLIGLENAETLAREIVSKGLSVREAEALTRKTTAKPGPTTHSARSLSKDADTLALEKNITDALGLSVSISHKGEKGGSVLVDYKTLEQLDEICRRLSRT
jgi:ParB family transcriptional regulator, chromosome partitioning protein